jgi:hypothetical protein
MAAMKPIAGSQHVWSAALRQTQKRLRRTAQLISSGPVGKEFLLTIPFVGSSDTRLPSWPEILAPSCARSADLPSAIIRIPSWRRSTAVYRHSREYVRPPPCVAIAQAPLGVVEVGGNSPQWHKLPAPLRQAVITGCRSPALRAAPAHSAARLQPDLNPLGLTVARAEPHFLINESHTSLYSIEDGLNL